MFYKLAIAAAALLASPAAAFNPGGTLSVEFATLQEAKNTYFDFVLNIVNQIQIPDISFDGGSLGDNAFHVTEAAENANFQPAPGNEIDISVTGLNAQFHSSHLAYKVLLVTAHGSVDAKMTDVAINLKVQIEEQTLPSGRIVPAVKVISSSVDLPKDHITLDLHGDIIIEFASLFKSLFMGTVRDTIVNEINNALQKEVPPALNGLIADQKGETEIYQGLDLDWSIRSAPLIQLVGGKELLSFGIKGLFFAEGKGEIEPAGVTAPVMPYHDTTSTSKLQAFVSNYLADSLGAAYLETSGFNFWTNYTMIPQDFPVQLDTDFLDIFFPGMLAHYGTGKMIDVEYNIQALRNLVVREGSETMSLDGDLALKFWVETTSNTQELAVEVSLQKLYFDFHAIIDGMQLRANVTDATLGDITVLHSTLGPLDMADLKALLDQVLDEGRPSFNEWIQQQSIIVPDTIFGLFELTDLTLKYHDGYLEAGLTPHFYPPTTPIFKSVEDLTTPAGQYRYCTTIDEHDKITFKDLKDEATFLQ